VAKYASNGKLLKVFPVPPANLLSDLKGKIYAQGENFVYDEELNYLETFKSSEANPTYPEGRYFSWTDWRFYKMKKDSITGKYNLGLRNLVTKQEIALKLPPGRITYGYIEGVDKDGNVYSAGGDNATRAPRQRIFFRINPIMQTVDTLRIEHKVDWSLDLAYFVSPNGEIYMASIDYEANKPKWYRIYLYSKNLFARME
jgi:hypothetical protein